MRGRCLVLALMLMMTAYGCTPTRTTEVSPGLQGSPATTGAPVAVAPAPVSSPPPPPSTAPVAQPAYPELCAPLAGNDLAMVTQRLTELKGVLDPALRGAVADRVPAAIQELAGCLELSPVEGSDGKVLIAELMLDRSIWPVRLAVWHYGGEWRSAPMPFLDDIGTTPYPALYRQTPDGPNLMAVMRNRGSGHVGGFALLRFRTGLEIGWKTELYGYFSVKRLGQRYFLATYRDEAVYDELHYYWGGCCYPTTGQILWEIQGDSLVQRASRTHPSVLRTASAFAGAWNQHRPDLAVAWAVDKATVKAMSSDAASEISLGLDIPKDVYAIDEAEAAYWDAIPLEFRGPEPSLTEYTWPSTPRPLLLRRGDGGWRVAGWGK